MTHSPQPPECRPTWRRSWLAVAGLVLLAGCAPQGDFGRVNPSLVSDGTHDWIGREGAIARGFAPSAFDYTDDERVLRDYAYPLIAPPYAQQKWYSVAGDYGFLQRKPGPSYDVAAYANYLLTSDDRSPAARYARLMDDINDDTTRLSSFYETAGRVLDMDEKRKKSLGFVAYAGPGERGNALARIKENASVVVLVDASLAQRVASYRFALERLVIATPSSQAVEVERALTRLKAQVAYYRHVLPPSWQRVPSLDWQPT
ncbi:MAG TPA: hypothetical protein VHT93_16615 [Pseudolabrys sp.]|nr:hypothetical protein [Pseudolabrys sp.]